MKKSKVIFLALLACAFGASARTVSSIEAKNAARAWVHRGRTLGARFTSDNVQNVNAHTTTNNAMFYTVKMANGGTVFMSGDTTAEPVIGFTASTDDFTTIDPKSPLWALLNHDVSRTKTQTGPQRAFAAAATSQQKPATATELKWESLIKAGAALPVGSILRLGTAAAAIEDEEDIDDLRVPALVKSQWSQSTARGQVCYNYYTPPGPDGSAGNAVCGCVATAMSQIMRYFQYPNAVVAPVTHTCTYNGENIELTMQGGTYDWENMTLVPAATSPFTEENRKAIGKLTSDAGIAVWMSYTKKESGAYTPEGGAVMKEVFGYKNAISFIDSDWIYQSQLIEQGGAIRAEVLQRTMFVNFDAGKPVLVSIPGHAVVADGYGYVEETDYVHFNMGWAGQADYWYNIPDLTEAGSAYNAVNSITYNLFTNDAPTSAIMSGRIVDDDGIAIADAEITIYDTIDDSVVAEVMSNERGIWSAVLAAGVYDVVAKKGKLLNDLTDVELNLPDSVAETWVNCEVDVVSPIEPSVLGNSWGNDMVLAEPTARIIVDPATTNLYASLDKALRAAQDGETVEILLPTILKKPVTLDVNCTIVATNASPAASKVSCRNGSQITVAPGATVVVSNVAFNVVDDVKTIVVEDGGVLAVGGYCDLMAVETAAYSNLVVAAELTYPFAVDCADAADEGATFAKTTLSKTEADAWANRLLNYSHTRLGGEAYQSGEDVLLRWKFDAPVPIEKAAGQLNVYDGRGLVNYRSLADIFDLAIEKDGDAEIVVLKDAPFGHYLDRPHKYLIRGMGDARPKLSAAGTSGFYIPGGGSLTISNLVFKDYVDSDYADDYGFIYVGGGELTLGDGAELNGIQGRVFKGSGVVDLMAGKMVMCDGAAIVNCKAEGGHYEPEGEVPQDSGGFGGAIYVLGGQDMLEFRGGTITNCYGSELGGAVYSHAANDDAGISISGRVVVADNWYSTPAVRGNVYMSKSAAWPSLKLSGTLSGEVGVRYPPSSSGNKRGDAFIAYADTMSPEDVETSAACFVNDADDTLEAVVGAEGRQLVWANKIDPGTCEEADATAHVWYEGATSALPYANIATAFAYLHGNTNVTVKMYKVGETSASETLRSNIAIPAGTKVVLMAGEGTTYKLIRPKGEGFSVPAGTSLTLTNIVISRNSGVNPGIVTNALVTVNGGALTLADGACISNILGNTARDAGAVSVCGGGTVTTLPGLKICGCENCFNYKVDAETIGMIYGCGGGMLVDEGSTAYLHGGEIFGCIATRGGGVYVSSGAKAYVSGNMRIANNKWQAADGTRSDGNVFVADNATVYLDGELTEAVGMGGMPWLMKDTNLVAIVDSGWAWSVDSLTNGAAHFVSDTSGDRGIPVSNDVETIVVWSAAVQNGVYTNAAGNGYAVVAKSGSWYVVVTNSPLPIAFSEIDCQEATVAISFTNLVAGVKYALYRTNSLVGGFKIEGIKPFTNFTAEADGPCNLVFPLDEPPAFWRVTGAETYTTNWFNKAE